MGSIVGRVHQRGRGHTWYGSEGGGGFDGCRDGRRDRCRGKCGHPPWSGGSAAAIRWKWCRRGDHGNVGGAGTEGIRESGRLDYHRGKMGRGARRWQLNGEGCRVQQMKVTHSDRRASGTWLRIITRVSLDPGARRGVKVGRMIHVGIVHVGACYKKSHFARHEYYCGWDVGF